MGAIDKRKILVVIGSGITGLLSVYEAVTKESDDIKRIIVIDKNSKGGNFLAGINIKWFYSYSSKKLFDNLGIKYSMKYHAGAVYNDHEIEIFPQYVMEHLSLLEEYSFKTRGVMKLDVNIMNTPYQNKLGNRVYFDIEPHTVSNELLFEIRHVAQKKNISVEYISEYVVAVDVFQKNVICRKDMDIYAASDNPDSDVPPNAYNLYHFDSIISTIPLLRLIDMTNFPDNSPLKEYARDRDIPKSNYFCKTIFSYPPSNEIWWDYLYVPEFGNPIRRINVLHDNSTNTVEYVCELVTDKEIDSSVVGCFFHKCVGINVRFGEIKKVSGFVDNTLGISRETEKYNIKCFGRYATLNSRAMINTTYEEIKLFFSQRDAI